jgi:hypothetical protein
MLKMSSGEDESQDSRPDPFSTETMVEVFAAIPERKD